MSVHGSSLLSPTRPFCPHQRRDEPARPPSPPAGRARTPFRSVVAYARPGVSSFGLSAVSNIFADRSSLGLPPIDFSVCADRTGALRTDLGLLMRVEHDAEAMAGADLVIVLPTDSRPLVPSARAVHAITGAYGRGALVTAYCSGTVLLAATGLLDGHRVATNRLLAGELAREHPSITVDTGALYVDQGRVVTGAGVTAGIDMCLYLLRREHGTAVANVVAREGMVAPRRDSGESHYVPATAETDVVPRAAADDARLGDTLAWARDRLRQPLTVKDLAERALMSPRTFARRFRELTGTTPHAWLSAQRLDRAEELLETTGLSVDEVAQQVGFRTGGVLRVHFARRHGLSPRAYRHAFDR
ncbi:helix-turn-helix domain-containing protein [Nonomuraea muscovyensis]|uniref:GlxA family transcriptional regulator n=1 Tax=Nonomuraea muscovyensis TaxID=1124761 RepID=UPI0033DBE597